MWNRGAAVLAGALSCAGMAEAESLVSRARLAQFGQQTAFLDQRASRPEAVEARLTPSYVLPGREPEAAPVPASGYRGAWSAEAREAARRHGVPEDLFLRLVRQESGFNPAARSHKGAIGLAQLMPGTARLLRVDPHDPRQNLDGGARYLRWQYDRFRDWRLALAAYNAGPDAVRRYGGVPPYRETQGYVRAILGS